MWYLKINDSNPQQHSYKLRYYSNTKGQIKLMSKFSK